MKYLFFTLIALSVLLITSVVVLAQPGLPSAPSQAPIDGGLSLLAVAGGAYAVRKLQLSRKKTEG
tara:strand:- start:47732 stop:47926 length:195 start_codon:yes stop_codon:yes gene_type:complete